MTEPSSLPALSPPATIIGAVRRWWVPNLRVTLAAFARKAHAAWLLWVAYPTLGHAQLVVVACTQVVILLTPHVIVHLVYVPLYLRWTVQRPALLRWWRARPTLAALCHAQIAEAEGRGRDTSSDMPLIPCRPPTFARQRLN